MRADDAQRTSPRSDAALVEAAQAGDATAYAALFDRHRPAIEHLAVCLTRESSPDALVGAVFAEGLTGVLAGEAAHTAIRPWLLRLTLAARGTALPESATLRAWHRLDPRQQAIIWHDVVDEAPVAETALVVGIEARQVPTLRDTALSALREAYLADQRDTAAPLHARTHLDDLAAHADDCATCLGLWWAAEDLHRAHELAAAMIGAAAGRYLREPTSRRAPRNRPRWVPAVLIATAATVLAATSAGALAVAQWGPGGVPTAWGGLPSVPSAGASPSPVAETEDEDEDEATPEEPHPSATGSAKKDHDPTTPAPEESDAATPSPEVPAPSALPASMGVGLAFSDPDRLADHGQRLVRMNLQLVGENASPGARQVTVRFDFQTAFSFAGASGLSCTPSSSSVTCTRTLRPGETARTSVTVAADEARGRTQVWSSDTSGSPRFHSFAFGPWAGSETPSPEPEPGREDGTTGGDDRQNTPTEQPRARIAE